MEGAMPLTIPTDSANRFVVHLSDLIYTYISQMSRIGMTPVGVHKHNTSSKTVF